MAGRNTSPFFWSGFDDEKLLDLRLRDLGLSAPSETVRTALAQIDRELAAKELRMPLHCWWAREWFTPDGVPGIALPFYLAHPRLIALERRRMHEAEGASPAALRKILRHEIGHAVMNAYRLRGRADVRALFGDSSAPYPTHYEPLPHSRRFVRHLPGNYAQSHPDEDFAETFAVWLGPRAEWRRRYAGWAALRKLEGLDRLLGELRGRPPEVTFTRRVEPLERSPLTLRQHYAERRRHFRLNADAELDRSLRRVFPVGGGNMTAERFLRKIKEELSRTVAVRSGRSRFETRRVLDRMIRRTRELGLGLPPKALSTERLADSTQRLLERGRHPIFM